jgi:hypothetical protein
VRDTQSRTTTAPTLLKRSLLLLHQNQKRKEKKKRRKKKKRAHAVVKSAFLLLSLCLTGDQQSQTRGESKVEVRGRQKGARALTLTLVTSSEDEESAFPSLARTKERLGVRGFEENSSLLLCESDAREGGGGSRVCVCPDEEGGGGVLQLFTREMMVCGKWPRKLPPQQPNFCHTKFFISGGKGKKRKCFFLCVFFIVTYQQRVQRVQRNRKVGRPADVRVGWMWVAT